MSKSSTSLDTDDSQKDNTTAAQNIQAWSESWQKLQEEQLDKYMACMEAYLSKQYVALQAIMKEELIRQLEHMKPFFEGSGRAHGQGFKSSSERHQGKQFTFSDIDNILVVEAPKRSPTGPTRTPRSNTDHSYSSMEVATGHTRIMTDEEKHAQLKKLWGQFRVAVGWHHEGKRSLLSRTPRKLEPNGCVQEAVLRVTNHAAFQVWLALLIISNTIVIGVEADESIRNALATGKMDTQWAEIVDMFFTPLFLIEVLLRILGERSYFFCGPSRGWNIFDVLIVATGLAELVFDTFSFTFMRVLRVFRMLRVLRVIRIFRIFRELRLMVVSIITSLLTLTWAFVLLCLLMFLFAVCFISGAANYIEQKHPVDEVLRRGLLKHFPSLSHSLYTLMAVISGGSDWGDVADILRECGMLYFYLFIFYIIFVVFGVLNVLIGVFVDSASNLSKVDHDLVIQSDMQRRESFLNQVAQLFCEIDTDQSGTISWQELRHSLEDPRIQAYFHEMQIEAVEAQGLFNLLDTDESGEVSTDEFMLGCMRLKGESKSLDTASLIYSEKKSTLFLQHQFNEVRNLLHQMNRQMKYYAGVLSNLNEHREKVTDYLASHEVMASMPGQPPVMVDASTSEPVQYRSDLHSDSNGQSGADTAKAAGRSNLQECTTSDLFLSASKRASKMTSPSSTIVEKQLEMQRSSFTPKPATLGASHQNSKTN